MGKGEKILGENLINDYLRTKQSFLILLKNAINIKDEFTSFLLVYTKGIETCSYLQLWGSSLKSRLRALLNTDEEFLSAWGTVKRGEIFDWYIKKNYSWFISRRTRTSAKPNRSLSFHYNLSICYDNTKKKKASAYMLNKINKTIKFKKR